MDALVSLGIRLAVVVGKVVSPRGRVVRREALSVLAGI